MNRQKKATRYISIVQGLALVIIFSLFAPIVSLKPLAVVTPSASAATSVKTIAGGTKYATKMYVIKSGVPGPVVMVVGGTHGNEPAVQAANVIKTIRLKKGLY